MFLSNVLDHLKICGVDLSIQNLENERQIDDDAGPDHIEDKLFDLNITICFDTIGDWSTAAQAEDERFEKLMELLDRWINE